MPSKRSQNRKAGAISNAGSIAFANYVSFVGIHMTLLVSATLFLPRLSQTVLWASSPPSPFLQGLSSDPVSTLTWLCVGTAVLQTWWAEWMRRWWIESLVVGTEKRRQRKRTDKSKFSTLKDAWLATIATSFMVHAVIVLLGAPLLSHNLHTNLLACLMSLLTVFTPAYVLGIPSFAPDSQLSLIRFTWTRLFAELSPKTPVERAMVYPVIGAALGGWTGAFPIPLDWERPWQAWPLTPAFGSILGYMGGTFAAVVASAVQFSAVNGVGSQPVKTI